MQHCFLIDSYMDRYNRPGANVSQGVIDNFWLEGMSGAIKGQYDCIKAFSETDFTEDLKKIDRPTLILHGDDDQIVPYADAALLSTKLVRNSTLKIYPGYPHGMATLHADVINNDILNFIKGWALVTNDIPCSRSVTVQCNKSSNDNLRYLCMVCVYTSGDVWPLMHFSKKIWMYEKNLRSQRKMWRAE